MANGRGQPLPIQAPSKFCKCEQRIVRTVILRTELRAYHGMPFLHSIATACARAAASREKSETAGAKRVLSIAAQIEMRIAALLGAMAPAARAAATPRARRVLLPAPVGRGGKRRPTPRRNW